MKKKYSIIIPVYNCQSYISRCIESIINQKHKSYEIILINDGSSDNSGTICDEYAKKNKQIKVIHKKNEGVSAARNDGLKQVNGKYICFLDSDDYIDKDFFATADRIIDKNKEVELINFGFYSEVENSNYEILSSDTITYKEKYYNSQLKLKKDFVNLWDNTMLYNIWNKVYSAKIIEENKITFPNYNWGEDVEFNRIYLSKINNMYNSKKCFYHYIRERKGAATKSYKPEFFDIRKKEFTEFNEYFEKWGIQKKDYYEYSCRRYIERVLGCIENVYCSNLKFKDRYKEIKKIILDPITRETLKYAQPKSKKIKIMLIPIKLKLVLISMLMGRTFNIIKNKFPSLFNKLKNRR